MAKGKKAKSPGKAKKGKRGGKGKPGSKGSSPGKAPSAAPSQAQSSTQLQTTGSNQEITAGSTAALTGSQSVTATLASGLFKPLNRPMLPPLVLPADHHVTLTRRPSPIVVWDWGNAWFFPVSVLALGVVVLCMISLSLNMQDAELVGKENYTAVKNATASNEASNTALPSSIVSVPFTQDATKIATSTRTLDASMSSGEQGTPTTGQAGTAESAATFSSTDKPSEAISAIEGSEGASQAQTETVMEMSEDSTVENAINRNQRERQRVRGL